MKILAISHLPNDENAGASRIYHLLARGLRERGHTVTVMHLEDLQIPRALTYFVRRLALPEFTSWRFFPEAIQGYDVIFASSGVGYQLFRKLRRRKDRPLLVNHFHGAAELDFEATLTEWARGHTKYSLPFMGFKAYYAPHWDFKGAQACDVVVTQSLRDLDYVNDLRELGSGRQFEAPAVMIPAVLHPEIEKASEQAVPPEKRDPASILWFGSWGERKGRSYINRAFRKVKEKHPHATLTLGGTGYPQDFVMSFFDKELLPSIRILPRIEVKEQLEEFNKHSIFIFPSLSEGFGLALIEAMAMGLACVTTTTGMMGDWIEDREDALLVPSASAEHLARAVLRLMEDDALRVKIARAGQMLALTFTLDRFVDGYLKVFELAECGKGGD